ncbi:ATP-binding protein [Streptomyces sp. NPDC050844]|uniref:sensor histidine kinase n=1 Tax=Streptomyces sp. NPDC050844 TaxID=3155790 RepID=UPI0033E6EB99
MSGVRPGQLKVYLGAVPGVGKTCRMLDEGRRRAARGTDLVVGFVECHRRPRVALVDELAHTNVPGGGRNTKRWQDVEELLDAGIGVVTAVNIQHLESLNDVVEKITGVPRSETVPDDVVRRAQQIELVDMAPESLRSRMAHGNIYAPAKVDAALANYFRPGNLTALRELALQRVAGQVDVALLRHRSEQGVARVWEARERVVVALTGDSEGETLIRRAARIGALPRALTFVRAGQAPPARGDLPAVHVTRSDGLAAGASHSALVRRRRLVERLGGSCHSVVGDDAPTALVEFARAGNATQLVLGTSRCGRLERFLTGSGIGETVVALSRDIDVHMVTHERAGRGRLLPSRRRTLPTSRLVAAPIAGLVVPVLLTFGLDGPRGPLNLTSEALLYLLAVVGVARIGGVASAVIASLTASLLLNHWFMPPVGEFTMADANSMPALAVFAVVAATVAAVVDRSLRLSRRSARATAEAETMSLLAGSIVRGDEAIPALLERMRETLGMESAELVEEPPGAGASGTGGAALSVPVGTGSWLLLRGRMLPSSERRVLAAFAAHVGPAVERARLAERAAEVEPVKAADRMRTALLRAVGHDLRTPLAAVMAAVSSLRSRDVDFSAEDRDELLASAEESLAKLDRLVENLLDLSRLQAGALTLKTRATALEEVLPLALDSPTSWATPPGAPVLVSASALGGRVELRVVDRGPGVPPADREQVFEPFQRLGDTDNTTGLGLGLALSRGLTEAMDGTLTPEDTPGGGLTMVLSLPFAGANGKGVHR